MLHFGVKLWCYGNIKWPIVLDLCWFRVPVFIRSWQGYFFITFVSSLMLISIKFRLVQLTVHHSSIHRILRLEIFVLLIVFVLTNVSLFRADNNINNIITRVTVLWLDVELQRESKKSPLRFSDIFSQTDGNFLINLIIYCTFLSTLDCKFLYNYLQLWRSYAILSATTQRIFTFH